MTVRSRKKPGLTSGSQAANHALTEKPITATQSSVDLGSIRQRLTNRVGNQAEEMVEQMIEHVKAGNYPAMKYLFEMVGLFPATPASDSSPEDTLATRLWNHLELLEKQDPVSKSDTSRPGKAASVP